MINKIKIYKNKMKKERKRVQLWIMRNVQKRFISGFKIIKTEKTDAMENLFVV